MKIVFLSTSGCVDSESLRRLIMNDHLPPNRCNYRGELVPRVVEDERRVPQTISVRPMTKSPTRTYDPIKVQVIASSESRLFNSDPIWSPSTIIGARIA